MAKCCQFSTWSGSPIAPARGRGPAASMEPAIRPRSAPAWGEQPRAPVLRPSESAVSSLSPVEQQPRPTPPTPWSAPSPPPPTRTPAPTPTAGPVTMSAS